MLDKSESPFASAEKAAKTVSFHTLGCRLNFSETGSIAQGFEQRGYQIIPFGETSDVVFINTCTVTDSADSTCRNLIRRAHRSSPEGKIIVAGCYAQMDAPKIAKIEGVDLVLGTSEKYKVFDYLEAEKAEKIHIDKTTDFYAAATSVAEGHTRAFLKIQDGCNYICSYCIIPQARGRSRAISIPKALEEAHKILDQGFKEIVLTGVNIGEYESASGERLCKLVEEILALKKLKRLRLSSVEPNTLSDELLDVFASSPKFMDHFHVPLQSGDDEVLKAMRRKYDVGFYTKLMEKIMDRFPRAGIGADLITGHPGEREEHFNNTKDLVRELPLTHFHVFPFSKRKNTLSAKMPGQIQYEVKKKRCLELIEIGREKLEEFSKKQINWPTQVLFEREKDGLYFGHTPNFVQVHMKSEINLRNQILTVTPTEWGDQGLRSIPSKT